jgi:hypothetical protein
MWVKGINYHKALCFSSEEREPWESLCLNDRGSCCNEIYQARLHPVHFSLSEENIDIKYFLYNETKRCSLCFVVLCQYYLTSLLEKVLCFYFFPFCFPVHFSLSVLPSGWQTCFVVLCQYYLTSFAGKVLCF